MHIDVEGLNVFQGEMLPDETRLAGGAEAVYNASGLAYYRHADWLGSVRLASLPSGTNRLYYDGAHSPYGDSYAETGTTDQKFAGMEQDLVSSGAYPLYDALMREYNSTWGRWLSPDPMGGDITNPELLNRYAYALSNPTTFTDPLGLDSYNPADPSSDPTNSNARCPEPPVCWVGNPNCCSTGLYDEDLCYPLSGDFPPLSPWNPLPPIIQPTAADQLAALGSGEAFANIITCVDLSALEKALAVLLAAILGVPPSSIALSPATPPSKGGAADFIVNNGGQVNPTNIPYANHDVSQILHPGEHSQFWYPVPKRSVPGMGRDMHVLFNEGAMNASNGLPGISDVQVHMDVYSPLTKGGGISPWGAAMQGLTDMTTIAIISKAEGCAVKFQ